MRRCCADKERARQELWDALKDSISLRHGPYEPGYDKLITSLTEEEKATAKVLVKLEKQPMGEIIADAIAAAYPTSPAVRKAREDRLWETDLVPLRKELGWEDEMQETEAASA